MSFLTPDTMRTIAIGVGSGFIIGGIGHMIGYTTGATVGAIAATLKKSNGTSFTEQENTNVITGFGRIGAWTGKMCIASAASMVASNPFVSATIVGWSVLETADAAPTTTKKVAHDYHFASCLWFDAIFTKCL